MAPVMVARGNRRGETRREGFPARRSQFRPGIYPINFRSVEWQRARRGSRLAIRYINAAELAASPPRGFAPKWSLPLHIRNQRQLSHMTSRRIL